MGQKRGDTDRPESDKVTNGLVSSWAYMSLGPLTACQSWTLRSFPKHHMGVGGGTEESGDIPGTGGVGSAGSVKAIQALNCHLVRAAESQSLQGQVESPAFPGQS